MKYDKFGCVIREKYEPEFHLANLGDSCAETCRDGILGGVQGHWGPFILANGAGYVRHPLLEHVPKWDAKEFSVDQALALFMFVRLKDPELFHQFQRDNTFFIRGTWTILSVGAWAVLREQWGLLERANQVQGWLLTKKYRWSDGKKWFEKTEGQVQDYLNMICIHLFLKAIGEPTTLPRPVEECMAAVRKYYLFGEDAEPNSEWIVEMYRQKLGAMTGEQRIAAYCKEQDQMKNEMNKAYHEDLFEHLIGKRLRREARR